MMNFLLDFLLIQAFSINLGKQGSFKGNQLSIEYIIIDSISSIDTGRSKLITKRKHEGGFCSKID